MGLFHLVSNPSPMITASKLTALAHTKQSSQPIRLLCAEGLVIDRTLLAYHCMSHIIFHFSYSVGRNL